MRIDEAFPRIFERAYPVLDPKTPMISVLPLLRFHEIDALPLSFDSNGNQRGIFGFSCLARILTLGPEKFSSFMERPCEDVSEPLATVQARSGLARLLDTYLEARFGFARVVERRGVGALLSLDDTLRLFDERVIDSALEIAEVASEVFSLPMETTLREALDEMFARRYRRVFVRGTKEFIWDRGIIEHLFSPAVLARVAQDPSADPLGIPISGLTRTKAKEAEPSMTLSQAAKALGNERGQCLVFDGKVVTPWDVVMKPWKTKRLKIRTN
ncbi:MAG TPA: hypothetical protein VEH01_00425 [Nitrososphaerales archaeon]|nr:hypothetical protein [Nitrososphaerales archaeon]